VGLETRPAAEGRPAPDASEAAPVEGRAASQPPGAEPDAPTAPAGEISKIVEKSNDLEAIKKAVDDAAAVSGGLWLSYLFVLFYLAIAAGAVTHADLFLENSVKLPFLNVELPLLAFFFLAPILFIIVHAYTLVHLVMLTDKAKRFDGVLRHQVGGESAAVRDSLRWQLPSNIFIQFLAGPTVVRDSAFGWLLRAIAWVTLVVAPVLLLLLLQLQFLPFHNSFITWTQRIALVVDLGLMWWLWRKILSGREVDRRHPRSRWTWPAVGLTLSACAALFSWTAATFPGEWQEDHLPDWRLFPASDESGRVSLHDWVFQSKVDPATSRRSLPFSSTLILSGLNVYEGLNIDDPEKARWREFVFRARGRDLKGAIFDLASLPKVDFTGAELQGASLFETQLQGASLDYAELRGASLFGAQLQGASLFGAQLQGASLYQTRLQGASLDGAQLQGASLDLAQLQGASLDHAQLQGASLAYAELQGASLYQTRLQGASLDGAQLQGASLQLANLKGTDLSLAYLWRTNQSANTPGEDDIIKLSDARAAWPPSWSDKELKNHPWNDKAYRDLRNMMESLLPSALRDRALERIRSLDCANSDATLASCDPSLPPPPEATAWRNVLEAASVDGEGYTKALAATLKELVCSGEDDAIHVVRGAGFQRRLEATGAVGIDLIDDLMNKDSKDCPVSAFLSEADSAKLRQIKQLIAGAGK
jgi:uncharacterized protein YjbI with pentapeptide repeats